MRVQFSTPKYGPMKQDGPERGYVPTISGFRWANENEDVYHSPVWPRMRIDTKPIVIMDRTTYQDDDGWWVLGPRDEFN